MSNYKLNHHTSPHILPSGERIPSGGWETSRESKPSSRCASRSCKEESVRVEDDDEEEEEEEEKERESS